MVTADSHAVAVAGHLPDSEFGVGCLNAGSDSTAASVNGVEAVGTEVVRHARGAADAADDGDLMRRDADLRHGFLQRHADSVVTAARAETYVLVGFILTCFHDLSFHKINYSFDREGLSFYFVVLLEVQSFELRAEVGRELSGIEFANDDAFVFA